MLILEGGKPGAQTEAQPTEHNKTENTKEEKTECYRAQTLNQ